MLKDINYGLMIAEILGKLLRENEKLQQIFSKKGMRGLFLELGKHPDEYGLMEADQWIKANDNDIFKALGLMPNQISETVIKWIHEELPNVNGENYWEHNDEIKDMVQRKIVGFTEGNFDDPGLFYEALCHVYGTEKWTNDDIYAAEEVSNLCDRLIWHAQLDKNL